MKKAVAKKRMPAESRPSQAAFEPMYCALRLDDIVTDRWKEFEASHREPFTPSKPPRVFLTRQQKVRLIDKYTVLFIARHRGANYHRVFAEVADACEAVLRGGWLGGNGL